MSATTPPTTASPAGSMASALDLSGRVVWVTGSSRGIGAGVAEHLAAEGATVVVHGRSAESTAAIAERLTALGATWLAVHGDVRSEADCERMVAEIGEAFGHLDGLVANVGGAAFRAAADSTAEAFTKQLQLNLVASFATARAARTIMTRPGAAIVLVSATAASSATPMFAAYGAAKAGVEHLAASLAAEWGPAIRVNAVSPGLILTDGSATAVFQGSQEKIAKAGATTAVGRIGQPVDIARACHFLLSDAAGYVSGTTLVVDGGPVDGPTQRILKAIG